MKSYIVGGWVRDHLLARESGNAAVQRSGDRDWVVVGSTPGEMVAAGFRPVGRDFPVFLHPQSGEEYALARTERKTAPGYRGFVVHAAPDVSLEQDLQRRDLTVNAIAMDEAGMLIDPCNGQADLRGRVLRHVGPAFAEDPVRILRLARFAARFPQFSIAPETLALAQSMVAAGEGDALVPERVWQELARGLMEAQPSRMIRALMQTGLLARLAPGIAPTDAGLAALDRAAQSAAPLPARFAVLAAAAPSLAQLQHWVQMLRADNESSQLARLLHELRAGLRSAHDAPAMLSLLERADALRRGPRFELLLAAAEALDGPGLQRWRTALAAAAAVDAGAIARAAGPDTTAIAAAVRRARVAALEQAAPAP